MKNKIFWMIYVILNVILMGLNYCKDKTDVGDWRKYLVNIEYLDEEFKRYSVIEECARQRGFDFR